MLGIFLAGGLFFFQYVKYFILLSCKVSAKKSDNGVSFVGYSLLPLGYLENSFVINF